MTPRLNAKSLKQPPSSVADLSRNQVEAVQCKLYVSIELCKDQRVNMMSEIALTLDGSPMKGKNGGVPESEIWPSWNENMPSANCEHVPTSLWYIFWSRVAVKSQVRARIALSLTLHSVVQLLNFHLSILAQIAPRRDCIRAWPWKSMQHAAPNFTHHPILKPTSHHITPIYNISTFLSLPLSIHLSTCFLLGRFLLVLISWRRLDLPAFIADALHKVAFGFDHDDPSPEGSQCLGRPGHLFHWDFEKIREYIHLGVYIYK